MCVCSHKWLLLESSRVSRHNCGAADEVSEANEAAYMCNAPLSCDTGIHYKLIAPIQSLWKVGSSPPKEVMQFP